MPKIGIAALQGMDESGASIYSLILAKISLSLTRRYSCGKKNRMSIMKCKQPGSLEVRTERYRCEPLSPRLQVSSEGGT